MSIMDSRTVSPLNLRRCASTVGPAGFRCTTPPVAMVVVSFPSGARPDVATFWCRPHLDAVDVAACGELMPSARVLLEAS